MYVACDLGATNLRVASFVDGRITRRARTKTPHGGGAAAIVGVLVDGISSVVRGRDRVDGICIGVPAPVDPRTGLVREASNLPEIVGASLRTTLRAHFDVPLFVRNDAMLATLGEHRFGAGRGVRNMVYFTISTGIGGGVIVGGRLLAGAAGYAGEMGELLVPSSDLVKLEDVASGSAIARLASAASSRAVAEAAREGDVSARRVIESAATFIGYGVVNAVHLLNPELVVLGGGVMKSADLILSVVRKTAARLTMASSRVEIVVGTLGDDAGLFGAAAFLEDRQKRRS